VVARKATTTSHSDLRHLVTDSQSLGLIIALSVSLAGYLSIDFTFSQLGAPTHLMPLIHDYMRIFYVNAVLTLMAMSLVASVRAMGDSRLQASSMIAAAAVNLILDPIFIFGLWGFPRLELEGAALASTMARLVSCYIAYHAVITKHHLLTRPSFNYARLRKNWGEILYISLPAAATNMIIPLSATIITAMLASYGNYAVAGMGIASRIEPMLLIFFYSLSAIISPFAGQNLGARKLQRIYLGVTYACIFSMTFGLFLALLMHVFAAHIVALFTDDVTIAAVAVNYLLIVPISYGCAGVVMIVNASFNGIARPLEASSVSILRVIVLYLPLAYIGAAFYGVNGIFIAYSAVNIIAAAIAYLWFIYIVKQARELKQQNAT
jgi:putative MATE family efflux protein